MAHRVWLQVFNVFFIVSNVTNDINDINVFNDINVLNVLNDINVFNFLTTSES